MILQQHVKANNDWRIAFPSLKTPTDRELADVAKIKADTENAKLKRLLDLAEIGAMSNDEVRSHYAEELGLKGGIDEDQENQKET